MLLHSLTTADLSSAVTDDWTSASAHCLLNGNILELFVQDQAYIGGENYCFLGATLNLLADRKYFLGATIRSEPGTLTHFGMEDSAGHLISSQTYASSTNDWEFLGVTFALPPGPPDVVAVKPGIRFRANRAYARVFYKDFVLYELLNYRFYVRTRLIAPTLDPRILVRVDFYPYALRHTRVIAGRPETEWTVYAYRDDVFGPLYPGGWSDWRDIGNSADLSSPFHFFTEDARFTAPFRFRKQTSVTDGPIFEDLPGVQASFQVAVGPHRLGASQAKPFFYGTKIARTGLISMVLPEARYSLLDVERDVQFLSDIAARDTIEVWHVDRSKVEQPACFWVASGPNNRSFLQEDEPRADLFRLFQQVGLNALDEGPSIDEACLAEAHGLRSGLFYWRSWLSRVGVDYDLRAMRRTLEADAAGWLGGYDLYRLFSHAPERAVINVNDEAAGFTFTGDLYAAAFHVYLEQPPRNFVPGDFGAATWLDVPAASVRPDDGDAIAARRWYWQMRFWNEANAEVYRLAREVATTNQAWGGAYHFTFNFGPPYTAGVCTYRLGLDARTLAKGGAVSLITVEEDFNTVADLYSWGQGSSWHGQQLISLIADYCRALAQSANVRILAYIKGSGALVATAGGTAARRDYKVLAWAARGVTYLDHYAYGPFDLNSDGFGGLGLLSSANLRQIMRGNDLLSRAEDKLIGGTRPKAKIAMLAAQTDPLWADTEAVGTDDPGIYYAFTHGHQPVDYVFEEDISTGALLDETKVLYVNVRYLRDDAFGAIEYWVKHLGGTLLLGMKGAMANEYAHIIPERLSNWLGVTLGALQTTSPAPHVDWAGVSRPIEIFAPWRTIFLSGSGSALARYATGENAAVQVLYGTGKVVVVGFELGKAYQKTDQGAGADLVQRGIPFPGYFQTGYQEAVRAILLGLATELGLAAQRPVWTDDPLVEVSRVNHPTGGAVVLLNYHNEPVNNLKLTIPGVSNWITSQAQQATLPVTSQDGNGVVTLNLVDMDILTWGPQLKSGSLS